MARDKTKRLRPAILQEDLDAFTALKAIANYSPSNPDYKVTNGDAAQSTMSENQTLEVQMQAAADGQRDNTVGSEWDFHDFILGAKDQVIAQFGDDSNEVQSMGLKKKSEYKKPTRRNTSGE